MDNNPELPTDSTPELPADESSELSVTSNSEPAPDNDSEPPKDKNNDQHKRYVKIAVILAVLCVIALTALIIGLRLLAQSSVSGQAVEVFSTPSPTPSPSFIRLEPTPAPTPTPIPVYNVAMAVVGDIMLHEWQFKDAYNAETDEYEFDYTFEDVKKYLQDADFTIGNLETTFAGKDRGYAFYPTFNAPDSLGSAIKNAGFDFLTTANNHSNDKGESGILRTLDILDELGIDHTGTYRSQEDRDTVYVKDINGIKFAFVSYSYSTNGIPLASGKPYLINLLDTELIVNDIKAAKLLEPDFIIVMPHMGTEYATEPNAQMKNIVKTMFEAGADIVLASHPHVLQPMEFVDITDEDGTERKCFVIYSLGNFVSSQRTVPRDRSIILNLQFEKVYGQKAYLTDVSYVPTWVKFIDSKGRYNIKVLPVYDTILDANDGKDVDLRPADISHIKTVLEETNELYGGNLSSAEDSFGNYFTVNEPKKDSDEVRE